MKRPPAAESVTLTLSAWEVRVLRAYASRHWVPKDGHSWQEVALSLLRDAIEDAAGEMAANGEPVPARPGRAGRRDELGNVTELTDEEMQRDIERLILGAAAAIQSREAA